MDNRNYEYKTKSNTGKTITIAIIFGLISGLIGSYFGNSLYASRNSEDIENNKEAVVENVDKNKTNESVVTEQATTTTNVAKQNLHSVVGITTNTILRDFFNQEVEAGALGSGFIVDKSGYIVTNDHVIASAKSRGGYSGGVDYADDISVLLDDGTKLPAKVVWSDSTLDLAILKVDTDRELTPVKLGDSEKLTIGEPAIAIGNPLSIDFHGTVTAGVVSGLNRTVPVASGFDISLIQTDASINQGNSGGPLFNSKGEVIGINTLKISKGEGLGFSIPINIIKPILAQIEKNGTYEKPTLGISSVSIEYYEQVMQTKAPVDKGAYITHVYENSSAEKAGLKINDIIVKMGDVDIEDISDIQKEMYNYKIGDEVNIEYYRDGEKQETKIKLEKFEFPKEK